MIVKIINADNVTLLDVKDCRFFAEGGEAWAVVNSDDNGGQSHRVGVKAYVMNQSGTTIDTFVPKR